MTPEQVHARAAELHADGHEIDHSFTLAAREHEAAAALDPSTRPAPADPDLALFASFAPSYAELHSLDAIDLADPALVVALAEHVTEVRTMANPHYDVRIGRREAERVIGKVRRVARTATTAKLSDGASAKPAPISIDDLAASLAIRHGVDIDRGYDLAKAVIEKGAAK